MHKEIIDTAEWAVKGKNKRKPRFSYSIEF